MRKKPVRPIPSNINVPSNSPLDISALDTVERVIDFCYKNNLIKDYELDIEALINIDNNLKLKRVSMEDNKDAYIKEVGNGKFEIGVNSKHSLTRQRFSMAHEFAHYQLHREQLQKYSEGETILFRSDERNITEIQANRFASLILMPEELVQHALIEFGEDTISIAKKFNVSPLAMSFRVEQSKNNV